MPFSPATVTIASTTRAGVVSPDGTTIKITPGGILYDAKKPAPADTAPAPAPAFANAGLSVAAVGSPGLVRPDGVSIRISSQGVLYADGAAVPSAPTAASVSAFTNAGLTLASSAALGVVFVDGVSVLAAPNGSLSLIAPQIGLPPTDAFNCIVGSNLANSYVCLGEAERLLLAMPQSPGVKGWLQLTPEQKQQSLVASTLVLDALNWAGCKCDCQQSLQWPRKMMDCMCGSSCDEIPYQIQLATAYMAAFMGEQGGFLAISASGSSGGGSVAGLEPFAEVTVGPIKVKMKEGVTYGDTLATNIGQIPPFVADLIRNYLNAFGARQGYMGRKSIARAWGGYIGSSAYTGSMYLRGGKVYPRVGGWASDMETRNL